MVAQPVQKSIPVPRVVHADALPEVDFRWCSVDLHEVLNKGSRLRAAVFDVEGHHARELLEQCHWPLSHIAGSGGLASAFHFPRFKRIWVEESDFPIYQPAQITELDPKPAGYLSPITGTNIDALRVSHGQVLMTCSGRSGSIGRTTYVSRTLHGRIFSHDLIRIECAENKTSGYLYAFLHTKTGRALIKTNEYGAMIPHIEPSHLESVPVPNPPEALKYEIHELIARSYALRDESNELLHQGERLIYEALRLPVLARIRPRYFEHSSGLRNYEVPLSRVANRLDASYHVPVVEALQRSLKKEASEITTIADPRISRRIILPGRFARVYVQEGQGIPFFGGKQIFELDPAKKKFLSLAHHAKRIKEQLTLEQNMVMITCSGTIGKVALVPKHWEGWTASQHMIRIVPASPSIAGYLYVFLATDYGRELITRFSYGAVVPEIDAQHVAQVTIPLLKDENAQMEINRLALEANQKRTEAYLAEQEAIRITNEEVIHAGKK